MAAGHDGERAEHALGDLLRLMASHEAAEQVAVHPPIRACGWGQTGVGEERQTMQHIDRLEHFAPGTYEFRMQLELLEEAVTHHAMSEEERELPLFHDLDERARQTIDATFAAATPARVGIDGGDRAPYFEQLLRENIARLTALEPVTTTP